MPAKKRLVPPLRPNVDGTAFVRGSRGYAPARNRGSGTQTLAHSTSSSTASTSSSESSSLRAEESAVRSRGSACQLKERCERGSAPAVALVPPHRGGRTTAKPDDVKGRAQTAGNQVLSSLGSTTAADAAIKSPPSAASKTCSPKEAKERVVPRSAASASSLSRGGLNVPAGKGLDAAPIMLGISVDGSLGPSECLLAPCVMHRLGLQSGHVAHLSTSYGDVYAGVRPMRGSVTVFDRILVNDDAAAVLVDTSSVALRPVPLPLNGPPTLRSVTLRMVVPENARDAEADGVIVPSIVSTVEWQALFRRILHHKIGYAHLRINQRVLTHRIALEVVDLSIAREGEQPSDLATDPAAGWGIVTDVTEVRFCSSSTYGDTSNGAYRLTSSPVESGATEAPEDRSGSSSGPFCTLVLGDAGVGKSRWLARHASTAPEAEPQESTDGRDSSVPATVSTRHIEWVHVDQLPQRDGSEVSTATVLHEVFERARQSAPATVVMDDLHLICAREASSAGSRWAMSLIAHALAAELLDLARRRVDVRVCASAPTLASLDACLTSATLFGGSVVSLEMPSGPQERLECLRTCLSELSHSSSGAQPTIGEACLQEVAARAHGFTQRDLHRLAETAVVRAFQTRQSIEPTEDDLRAASAAVRPSSLKRFEVSVPNVTWADIGGSAEAKQTLCEVVEWCLGKQSWVFTEFNLTPPKGVLLYGPPGCSKTMLAKALANESHMNFISVKGPEVFSKWVGDSEKAVRDIFERARAASPCVVFIDELDGMCGHRGRGGVSDRVISQFLTELDGLPAAFQEKKNALVFVAATNRPDNIDGAVLRPGRIDRRVYVGLPTLPERCAITEIQFKHLPVAPELMANYVAERTDGYTGAEVVAVVKEAAFHAITANVNASHVTVADVNAALQKVRPRINAQDVEWYKHWPHSSKVCTTQM
ncbi:aaa family ATPase-like protein [Leishmania tarentolae]|uniref:Aaa family ATPase-like protein n=1 Tax=Leishmania tarentolae TaxID=5689 RepID=A0A640KTQ4_LEITA|nr:aaa family ATPase-like protein [Leishmania tarentolae]